MAGATVRVHNPPKGTPMPRTSSILLLGVLAGIAGGVLVLAFVRSSPAGQGSDPVGIPKPESDLMAVLESLRSLEQRVGRMETALASRETSSTREPVKSAAGSTDSPEPRAMASEDLIAIRAEMLRLSRQIEGLQSALSQNRLRWIHTPTTEQFERARVDVNWALVEEIRALHHQDYSLALDRVRAMTLDDILQQLGKPTSTDYPGIWSYTRPRAGGDERSTYGISLHFEGDRVVAVGATD